MSKTVSVRMCDLPRLWDETDGVKTFTVGRGRRRYDLWTCGPCGLHYVYYATETCHAAGRRAVEPSATVHLHIEETT